jgi:hypothetical protein
MQGRWFSSAVALLWLVTMSWLVTEKVAPSLQTSDAPNYTCIIEAQKPSPRVCWRISCNDRPIGWAISDLRSRTAEAAEIRNRVHFDSLPLRELIPAWLQLLSPLVKQPVDGLQLDNASTLSIDPLGHLHKFESRVRVSPLDETITLTGTVEGRQLHLEVHAGDLSFTSEATLPSDALLCDAFSPQTQLPDLHVGKSWNVPVFNPVSLGKNPLELVRATVDSVEPMLWDGAMTDCWLVVYRNDTGNGAVGGEARGKLWVSRDGTVLKQQLLLFNSTIAFNRLTDDEATKLGEEMPRRLWRMGGDRGGGWGSGWGGGWGGGWWGRGRRPHD